MRRLLAHIYMALHNAMPLWHKRGGWRQRVWFAVASRAWFWWERMEGRI